MKALVIGAGGKIGKELVKALASAGYEVRGTTRKDLDLAAIPQNLPSLFGKVDVVYLCAAKTRFIDCEADSTSYTVNVDAPLAIAKQYSFSDTTIVYLSSEAVERALHTNYGMHKALAEIGLRAVCDPVIARIGKVDTETMPDVCNFLVCMAKANPGVHRWSA